MVMKNSLATSYIGLALFCPLVSSSFFFYLRERENMCMWVGGEAKGESPKQTLHGPESPV